MAQVALRFRGMSLCPTLSEPTDVAVIRGVAIRMPDGTELVSDMWNTDPARPRPVVLERTPYGRARTDQAERRAGAPRPASRAEVAAHYAEAGFAYVVQDCRGTGSSGGDFEKYAQEQADSSDTIRWIRAQSWCDGTVVTAGFSYGAACQLAAMAAGGQPPDAAVLDCGGFSDALTSGIRQGGALALKQATWAHAQAIRDAEAGGDIAARDAIAAEPLADWLARGAWAPGHSPLAAAPSHERNLAALWQNSLDGEFWDRPGLRTPPEPLGRVPTRALFVTSWHDTSLRGTIENHAAMAAPGATCPAPALIIGPWSHGDRWSTRAGGVDFGRQALCETAFGVDFRALRRDFLAGASRPEGVHWFEIFGEGARASDHIRLGGHWTSAATWPPAGAVDATFVLGRGTLDAEVTEDVEASLVSDPDDPVPTLGGAINSGGELMPGGMFDQAPLDHRRDILRFRMRPFDRPLRLAGPVHARIRARSDAPDFDIAVELSLVLGDGTALNLSDGICRARHRNGFAAEDFPEPGVFTTIPVDLNPVGAMILPGQSLRLDIAGSNFPCFDVNPQTGAPQGRPGPRRAARITLRSGPAHPSTLTLTVLPR